MEIPIWNSSLTFGKVLLISFPFNRMRLSKHCSILLLTSYLLTLITGVLRLCGWKRIPLGTDLWLTHSHPC